ncbi:MAG: hypothetical protein MUF58_02235 [Arcicella sp.]|jgi:hypothetical protein|nr:hypothetical protein [Arcicella sp.]
MNKIIFFLLLIILPYQLISQTNIFPSTGNTGIGTSTPFRLFTLRSITDDTTTLRFEAKNSPTDYFTEINNLHNSSEPFYINNSGIKILTRKSIGIGTGEQTTILNGYNHLGLSTGAFDPSLSSVRLFINSIGNVGIGTTAPNEPLEVAGRIFVGNGAGATRKGLLIDGTSDGTFVRLHPYDYAANKSVNLVISPFGGGNVGIGTTTPNAKLQIGENIPISNRLSLFTGYSDNAPLTEWGDGGQVFTKIFRTSSNAMKMVTSNYGGISFSFVGNYDFTGNVGIGTTTPQGKLELGDLRDGSKFKIGDNDGNVHHLSWNRAAVFNVPDQGNGNPMYYFRKTEFGNISNFTNLFEIFNTGTIKSMGDVIANGNVRINGLANTSAPVLRPLAVDKDGNVIVGSSNSTIGSEDIVFFNNTYIGNTPKLIRGVGNGGAIRFASNHATTENRNLDLGQADNNGTFYPRLTVQTESGNIGIGTTNPVAKLDIKGNNPTGIQYLRTDAQDARISIGDNSGKIWSWATGWGGGTAGDFSLIEEGIAGDRIYVKKGNGNVGIGTITPSEKLTVFHNGSNTPFGAMGIDVTSFSTATNASDSYYFRVRDIGAGNYVPFIIKGTGSVGIGTTTPETNSILHINGGHGNTGTLLQLPASANANNTGDIFLKTWVSEPLISWEGTGIGANINNVGLKRFNNSMSSSYIRFVPNPTSGFILFSTIAGNGTKHDNVMAIVDDKVGIGTSTPTGKFEISASNGTAKFKIGDASGNSTNHLSWNTGAAINVPDQGGANPLIYFRKTDYNNLNNFTDVFQVKSDGSIQAAGQVRGGDLVSLGTNSWIFHTNDDGRKSLNIAPGLGASDGSAGWDFNKGLILDNTGELRVQGNLGVGLASTKGIPTGYKLAVGGDVIAERVVVKLQTNWPDCVFKTGYSLRSLSEVEAFVKTNSHLPDVPSEAEIKEKGIDVEQMNATLLKKVEELTLYLIEMKKENEKQTQAIEKLKLQVNK